MCIRHISLNQIIEGSCKAVSKTTLNTAYNWHRYVKVSQGVKIKKMAGSYDRSDAPAHSLTRMGFLKSSDGMSNPIWNTFDEEGLMCTINNLSLDLSTLTKDIRKISRNDIRIHGIDVFLITMHSIAAFMLIMLHRLVSTNFKGFVTLPV